MSASTTLISSPTIDQSANAPSPSLASECPASVNPFWWLQDASGNYHTLAGVDQTNYTGMGNGHLVFCRPMFINGSKDVPMPFKNGLLGIYQKNGAGEDFTTNDNRAIAGANLVNSSYTAGVNSTLEGIYFEADVQGTPTLGNDIINPLNESVEAIAGVVGDSHTGQVSGPMVGVRGTAISQTTSANAYTGCGQCMVGVIGTAGLATNGVAQTFSAIGVEGYCSFVANDGNRSHFGGCFGGMFGVQHPGLNNYGVYVSDVAGELSTNADYGLFVSSNHGTNVNKSRFQSAVVFDTEIRTALPGGSSPGNTDTAGQVVLSNGVGSYTFKNASNTVAPICTVSDPSGSAVSFSTTATTLTLGGTGSDTVNYICVARN